MQIQGQHLGNTVKNKETQKRTQPKTKCVKKKHMQIQKLTENIR